MKSQVTVNSQRNQETTKHTTKDAKVRTWEVRAICYRNKGIKNHCNGQLSCTPRSLSCYEFSKVRTQLTNSFTRNMWITILQLKYVCVSVSTLPILKVLWLKCSIITFQQLSRDITITHGFELQFCQKKKHNFLVIESCSQLNCRIHSWTL